MPSVSKFGWPTFPLIVQKWNVIEHCVFPHLTRAIQGVVFDDYETFKSLLETTTTQNGLYVRAHILDKKYLTGRKASPQYYEDMPIFYDEYLPDWNYTAVPRIY